MNSIPEIFPLVLMFIVLFFIMVIYPKIRNKSKLNSKNTIDNMAPTEGNDQANLFCTNCGQKKELANSFCGKCGNAFSKQVNLASEATAPLNPPKDELKVKNLIQQIYGMNGCIFIFLIMPNAKVNQTTVNTLADPIGIFIALVVILNLYLTYAKKYKPLIFTSILIALCASLEAFAIFSQSGSSTFVNIEAKPLPLLMPIIVAILSAYYAFKLDNRFK